MVKNHSCNLLHVFLYKLLGIFPFSPESYDLSKMKLASNFYCHVLIVARDGFITTFPTECVMSPGQIHHLPILLQSSFVPSDILVSAFMVYVFLRLGMYIYICIQHKPQITEDTVVSDLDFLLLPTEVQSTVQDPFFPLF